MAKSAEELLIYLFDEILPKHGMNLRVKQKELSLEMLRALQENKLALCEAEVGTGKTHAYILALTVHNIYSDKKIPAVISTSTIALQKRNSSLRSTKLQEPKPRNTRPSSKMWMHCWPFQWNRNNSGGMNLNKFL